MAEILVMYSGMQGRERIQRKKSGGVVLGVFLFGKRYLFSSYYFYWRAFFSSYPFRFLSCPSTLIILTFYSRKEKKEKKAQKLLNLLNSLGDKDNCTELDLFFLTTYRDCGTVQVQYSSASCVSHESAVLPCM
ncbi:hypothetical protein HOY82DRAFT_39239 [Tuber indicum]|nr:hypothetical protein HOY82DRAFT_248105 [Tuber indicum]KAG0128253.1 hypothetical protein HOY82DRAFT_39239 [Tuber indicum]